MVMLGFTVIEMVTETDEETSERSWWLENSEHNLKLNIVVQQTFVKNGSDGWQALAVDVRSHGRICMFKCHDPEQSIDVMGERVLKLALWHMDEEANIATKH